MADKDSSPRPAGRHFSRKKGAILAGVVTLIFAGILFLPSQVPERSTDFDEPKDTATAPRDVLSRLGNAPAIPAPPVARSRFPELDEMALEPSEDPEADGETLAEKLEQLREQLYISGLNGSALVQNSRKDRPSQAPSRDDFDSELAELKRDLDQAQASLPQLLAGSFPSGRPPVPQPRPEPSKKAGPVQLDRSPAATGGAVLHRGSIIPAILVTGIQSDLPGEIRAQVRRDVFDTVRFDQVAIPRGSALLGTYDQSLAVGQNRLFVKWDQLRYPDGSTVDLPDSPGVGLGGASGIKDRVNHHTWPIFRDAALLGLVSAAFQLGQPSDDRGDGSLSSREIAAGAVNEEFERAAGQLLRRQSSRQPTIRIRPGANFNVLVTRELVFPSW